MESPALTAQEARRLADALDRDAEARRAREEQEAAAAARADAVLRGEEAKPEATPAASTT